MNHRYRTLVGDVPEARQPKKRGWLFLGALAAGGAAIFFGPTLLAELVTRMRSKR